MNKLITSTLQVAEIAQKYFQCNVQRIRDEVNGLGSVGYKLIVGFKLNKAYDPNANPDRADLTPEMRALELNKANPREADVRIIWLKPGSTEEDLKIHLQRIKDDLHKTKIIPEREKNVTGINSLHPHKSDADIAAEVARGEHQMAEDENDMDEVPADYFKNKTQASVMNEMADDYPKDEEDYSEPSNRDVEEEHEGALGEIAKALNTLNDNISNIDNRLTKLESRKPVIKKGTKKKHTPKPAQA